MKEGVRVDVIVPAHNEATHIGRVLATMPGFVDVIWVVDDGSTDNTASQIRSDGKSGLGPVTRLLRHPQRRGVGAALRTGYEAAFADGADLVAVMAGDGQMDPEDLGALVAPLITDQADYAKGNRLGPSAWRRMPPTRLLGNHILSALTRIATGLPVGDSQCGYTALSRKGALRLPWSRLWCGYGYPNDLLGWAAITRLRVTDIPVKAIYADEVSGVRLHHAVGVVPFLLSRVVLRRWRYRKGLPEMGELATSTPPAGSLA